MFRNIEKIIPPPQFHMVGDGFRVHNFIPSTVSMERMNPIIMLDYNSKHYFSPSSKPRGVDVHPHRGFETITIAYKGKIAHHDSMGNFGIISEGEVQWMTAASGILHKEYHEEEFSRKGGDFHMVQLWLNLPAKDKMSEPKYQNINRDQIKRYNLPNKNSYIELIAGEYNHVKGPASSFTPAQLMNVFLKKDEDCDFQFQVDHNTCFLVVEGEVVLNEKDVAKADQFILFRNEDGLIRMKSNQDATVLLISVEPIHEPIAAYGPFVMNTQDELREAFRDYQGGKFGKL